MYKNIILIGYMGCGKSSIGKKIAEFNSMDYIDLDNYIERQEGKSVSEIFNDNGEVYFRKVETKCLEECLHKFTNTVFSLGGGTPCFGSNMEFIHRAEGARSIYLNTSITELAKRLFVEKDKRPLIAHTKDKEELVEFIAKHIFERLQYYQQANFTVKTDGKTIAEIAKEILELE